MKMQVTTNPVLHGLLSSAMLAAIFCAIPAKAQQFNLDNTALFGNAASYAVLYEGAGSDLTINSTPLNGSTISGNIGLGDENGGTPAFDLNNPAVINGNVNFAGTANVHNSSGTLNGTVSSGVTQVETDLNDLNSYSSTLGGESGTALTVNMSGTGGSQTISAVNGNLVSGNRIFTLNGFTFNNGNTLYISGDAAGDSVVINVTGSVNDFAGAIVLEGGLTANQVLFNIIGGNTTTLSGGLALQTAANNATQTVTYLDPDGKIQVNSVNIEGHLFGGDSSEMSIVSGGTVQNVPGVPVPEASTIISGALMLLPLGISALRALRQNRAAIK